MLYYDYSTKPYLTLPKQTERNQIHWRTVKQSPSSQQSHTSAESRDLFVPNRQFYRTISQTIITFPHIPYICGHFLACHLVNPLLAFSNPHLGKENMKNDIANGNKHLYPLSPAIDIHRSVFHARVESDRRRKSWCFKHLQRRSRYICQGQLTNGFIIVCQWETVLLLV